METYDLNESCQTAYNNIKEHIVKTPLIHSKNLSSISDSKVLHAAAIAAELLDTMALLFGSIKGGLGISVTIVGALLAASTGIVGATVVTMGLLSLPTMLKRGYSPTISTGTICAAGTLGQIIPPSIVLKRPLLPV